MPAWRSRSGALAAVLAVALTGAACGDNASTGSIVPESGEAPASALAPATSAAPATTAAALATTAAAPATSAAAPAASDAGKAAFSANCAACHTLAAAGATGAVGPNLDTLAVDQATIEHQIQNGGGAMPPFAGTLDAATITAIAQYVVGARSG